MQHCYDWDHVLKACEDTATRPGVADTVLKLIPGERLVFISSVMAARLPFFTLKFQFGLYRHETSLITLATTDPQRRCVHVPMDPSDQETFCRFVHAMHLSDTRLLQYVKENLRVEGYLLPVLEMAHFYGFDLLIDYIRQEISLLIRQLLDNHDLQGAFDILQCFLDQRTVNTVDGSFQSKSSQELERHPFIQQVVHFLRISSYKILCPAVALMARLPSLVIIHLILFPGRDFEEKKQLFVMVLVEHALQIQKRKASDPKFVPSEIESSMEICASYPAEHIYDNISKIWERSLEPISSSQRRFVVRTRSEEGKPRRAIHSCLSSAPLETERRRAASMPLNPLSGSTERMDWSPIPPTIKDENEMVIDFAAIPAMQRFDSIELSTVFDLRNASSYYHSPAQTFEIKHSSWQHHSVPHSNLQLAMRLDTKLKEVLLVGCTPCNSKYQNRMVSYLVDWDVDPCLWSHQTAFPTHPVPGPNATVTFRGTEPIVLARHKLDHIPEASTQPYHICVYLKMIF